MIMVGVSCGDLHKVAGMSAVTAGAPVAAGAR